MTVPMRINGQLARLEFAQAGETWRFRFESQQERTAEIVEAEPGVWSVLVEGRSYEVRVEGATTVVVGTRRFSVEVIDPRRWKRNAGGYSAEGRQSVAAPMPGRVVRVLVAEGDQVKAGQGLVVVEAMKMQNEMKAPKTGRVVVLRAVAGAAVNAGDILAAIE